MVGNCPKPLYLLILKKITTFFIMPHFLLAILMLYSAITLAMAPKFNLEQAVENAVKRYGLRTEPQLKYLFQKSGVAYPPRDIALLAFKKERSIQLWAKDYKSSWHYIHSYPLTAYSGRLGPKLKEYDRQIPEGIYRLTTLNPFSSMHLSIMINYPNSFDRMKASHEGRRKLGSNIFLHGKSLSVGCLAVGDKAIDQLFLLVHRVGLNHALLIISPNDLRKGRPATPIHTQPKWLPELYRQISVALRQFPLSHAKSRLKNNASFRI